MGAAKHTRGAAIPPLMSQQTTAKSKELRKGNTEIKTAANVFSDIPIEILIILITIINHLSRIFLGVLPRKSQRMKRHVILTRPGAYQAPDFMSS